MVDSHGKKLGLRVFGCTSSISTYYRNFFLARKDYRQAPHVEGSMTI